MPQIQNPIDATVVIPGTPSFAPGEVREVSDEEAAYFLAGTPLVLVGDAPAAPDEDAPKKARSPKSPPA